MKKVLSIALLSIMIIITLATVVNASTNKSLPSELYSLGAKYGATTSDKLKVERYLADNPVTDAQADQIMAEAHKAVAIMEATGVTDVRKLPAEKKKEIEAIANNAASIVGVSLTYKNGTVEVYKNGKLIEILGLQSGKLPYTGNSVNKLLVVSSIVGIALIAIFVVARKKNANE